MIANIITNIYVEVENEDATLRLTVRYIVRRTGEAATATITR